MPPGNDESEAPGADDLVSAEAAEAAAAAAEARAEAARARANELRRKLDASREEVPTSTDTDIETATEDAAEPEDAEPAPPADKVEKKRRLRLPRLKTVAATLAVLVIAGLLSATGYMTWEHRKAEAERHRTAEFSAAARQGVVNLMSMDYTKAKESVQRVIDDATGKFKTNFQDSADDLIKALQDSKMVTKVTVNDTAVESMKDETAVVLVAATSHREGPGAPKEDQQPRVWRVVLTVQREGGQIKVADLEFV